MKLSENFSLEELTTTSTGIKNQPDNDKCTKLLYLVNYILQPLRDRWGRIQITSGYRSYAVNIAVGGSPTSQHCKGEAADIIPVESDLEDVYRWLVSDSRIAFGQAIYEKGEWIHISLPRINAPNGEALIFNGKGYEAYKGVLL